MNGKQVHCCESNLKNLKALRKKKDRENCICKKNPSQWKRFEKSQCLCVLVKDRVKINTHRRDIMQY